MRSLAVVALGGLAMVAAILSHQIFLLGFAVFFVPGGVLVYYLRERELFLHKTSGTMFSVLLSFVVSFVVSGLNSEIITPTATLGTQSQQFLIAGLSLSFTAGMVLLLELMAPDTLPASWGVRPRTAMLLALIFALLASSAGLSEMGRHALWLLAAAVGFVTTTAIWWHRQLVRSSPQFVSIVQFYTLAWLVLMATAVFAAGSK